MKAFTCTTNGVEKYSLRKNGSREQVRKKRQEHKIYKSHNDQDKLNIPEKTIYPSAVGKSYGMRGWPTPSHHP